MRKRLPVLCVLIVSFTGGSFLTNLLAQGQCDPTLPLVTESAWGYRDRGDRCEGLYINQVSNTALSIASFTEFFEDFDINSANALLIEWDRLPNNNNVHLRAQGIRHKLYYRMDTDKPSKNNFYAWPSGILASLKISKKDLGITGKVRLSVGVAERDVYLPLRIRKQGAATRTKIYKLLIVPGVELSEMYITLASLGPDGRPGIFIKKGETLGEGYYPADRGIEISIAAPKDTGIYYLEIGATKRSGGTQTKECWFYNPG